MPEDKVKEYTEESLNRLNLSIDAKVLLQKINYKPEAVEIIEDKLRAFCPVHKDKNFRTLMVDLKSNHFKCHYLQCEGYKGGNLLYLYSIAQKCNLGESALFWSKTLNVPLEEIKAPEEEKIEAVPAPAAAKAGVEEDHFAKGVSFYTRNLLGEAIKEFELVLQETPVKELEVRNMLGLCFMKQGSHEKAVEEFKKGLECKGREEKEYKGLKYNLGRVYEASGKMKESLEIFKAIYEQDPKYQDIEQRMKKLEAVEGAPAPRKIKISYV
ncbi:hypothetical protein AUJ66_00385 [Candidatus Desantisbacteria bacterium CG1_02_38_46]|uniref:Uncharacterized protein n=1 Tax=Candidatus Desantisbacteria bacterium CG1_02_38_46 TaxID=1817893 RepID=A0A1J4SKD1_9BACT|nr:MAG: hypothetical protein AUJ66_00385 [Candidatus Desantisbacteria bacterium CG1_02_38_46]